VATVKVSPKYQVVIPRDVRESLGLRSGEKVQVFQYGDRIEFVPVRRMKKMRGFLKGIDTAVPRDEDRV
jgi:AbrB family looped-hinge helix DNA binding protein